MRKWILITILMVVLVPAHALAQKKVINFWVFTAQFDAASWQEVDWGGGRDAEFDYPKNHP